MCYALYCICFPFRSGIYVGFYVNLINIIPIKCGVCFGNIMVKAIDEFITNWCISREPVTFVPLIYCGMGNMFADMFESICLLLILSCSGVFGKIHSFTSTFEGIYFFHMYIEGI